MDKSWMLEDRRTLKYDEGVELFLEFAAKHTENHGLIRCPCNKCGNLLPELTVGEVRSHLYFHGVDQGYDEWIWHGEDVTGSDNETHGFISQQLELESGSSDDDPSTTETVHDAYDHFTGDPEKFQQFLEDAEKPLYQGCTKFTKLSALVELYDLKSSSGLPDKYFDELLKLIKKMLPDENEISASMYEAKKTLTVLGMEYEKFHACPSNCILYRNQYKDVNVCPKCGTSRWKTNKNPTKGSKGVPAKVLWYFPPIPRFKRMFQSVDTAKELLWHDRERIKDGKLRHVADSPAWKLVDNRYPKIAADPRNLRLALSADGMNPHGSLSSRKSCWPITMVIYNLPPSLCMNKKFLLLTMLISGAPGQDIDVYLAPLIDDLKTLWDVGVEVYDAYLQETFTLRAVLLWTINDFPAYGILCGCTVKGYHACPICSERTYSNWLKHCKKICYMGHRRFLPPTHRFRRQKRAFNGQQEFQSAPKPLSGEQVLKNALGINKSSAKKMKRASKKKKSKRTQGVDDMELDGSTCWHKKSVFFELEYWKYLLIRHILDVMHIEKNVCESIVATLLNVPGKSKDSIYSRSDLEEMGLRKELAPEYRENGAYLPPACYTLSRDEKKRFCTTLSQLKVPEGYSSNIRNCVSMNDLKLYGLKSHDFHTLMQQILPVAIRSILPKHVRYAIIRLCFFFRAICSKEIDIGSLDEIQNDLVETLCLLEKYFPPSFFDIMIHLTVHLVRELRLCGPVYLRWMYPFERFMKVLKSHVRNKNRPEGCIAECYIAKEAMEFGTEYLSEGIPSFRTETNRYTEDGNLVTDGNPLYGGLVVEVGNESLVQAHRIVLENTTAVQPYISDHMISLEIDNPKRAKNKRWLHDEHNRTFIDWIREKVDGELEDPNKDIPNALKWIAHGPCQQVIKYSGYDINGRRYHTKSRDDKRVNQNSGVSIVASSMHIASAKDNNPVFASYCYYGIIKEIWLLDYNMFRVPLFKCDWVDSRNGVRIDELGFTSVDLNKVGHKHDPFILASQARQVFYVGDQLDPAWSVVLTAPQREDPGIDTNDGTRNVLPVVDSFDANDTSHLPYVHADCEGILVVESNANK